MVKKKVTILNAEDINELEEKINKSLELLHVTKSELIDIKYVYETPYDYDGDGYDRHYREFYSAMVIYTVPE